MNFRTEITIQQQDHPKIDYHSKIFLLGSCFSENIGEKFQYFKFQSFCNPFGIVFHPRGIENLIQKASQGYHYTEKDLLFYNDKWQSFDAHSSLSSPDKNELLSNLNEGIEISSHQLERASHIIITLGTSWIYKHIASDQYVANCHKIPQQHFQKELLTVDEVSESLERIIGLIQQKNPKATVIFTVSPVRHLKDGFTENMQSKSHLLAGVHQAVQSNAKEVYFPSYEIMMDDLRDYRFYTSDLLHPNEMAIDYIWEKFTKALCTKHTLSIMQQVENIQKGLQHKPFDENSKAHQQFLKNLEKKIKEIENQFPFIQFGA